MECKSFSCGGGACARRRYFSVKSFCIRREDAAVSSYAYLHTYKALYVCECDNADQLSALAWKVCFVCFV